MYHANDTPCAYIMKGLGVFVSECVSEHGVLMNRCVLLFSAAVLLIREEKQSKHAQKVLELVMAHTCEV